ncbi:MAG: hypothetical protein WCL23_05945 [Candidatus Moraniibacteriota bacterium]
MRSSEDTLPKQHSHIRRVVFAIFLFLCIVCGTVVFWYASQPSQGTVKQISPDASSETPALSKQVLFPGTYLVFPYDSRYEVKTHRLDDTKDAIILETAYLSEISAFSKKIGLTVRNVPSGSLDDDPDYMMRVQNGNRYAKRSFDLGGNRGISFTVTDQGSFEKSYFVLNGKLLAILTVSAPGAENAKLDEEADAMVKGIEWKR